MSYSSASFDILLVEDNDFDAKRVNRALARLDAPHTLHWAKHGQEALQKLRRSMQIRENHSATEVGVASPMHAAPDVMEAPPVSAIQRPYIILLDLNMPVMCGLPFLKELRSDPLLSNAPVVVMTTSEFYKDVEGAHGLNVSGYVVKPVSGTELVEVIRRIIDFFEICVLPE